MNIKSFYENLFNRYSFVYTALCGLVMLIFTVAQFIISIEYNLEPSVWNSIKNLLSIIPIASLMYTGLYILIASLIMLGIAISIFLFKQIKKFCSLFPNFEQKILNLSKYSIISVNIAFFLGIITFLIIVMSKNHMALKPYDFEQLGIISGFLFFAGLIIYFSTLLIIWIFEAAAGSRINLPNLTDNKLYRRFTIALCIYFIFVYFYIFIH